MRADKGMDLEKSCKRNWPICGLTKAYNNRQTCRKLKNPAGSSSDLAKKHPKKPASLRGKEGLQPSPDLSRAEAWKAPEHESDYMGPESHTDVESTPAVMSEKVGSADVVSGQAVVQGEQDQQYLVHTIFKLRRRKGITQYCVRCYVYSAADDSSEPDERIPAHFISR